MDQSGQADSPQENEFASLWDEWRTDYDYVKPVRSDIRQGTVLVKGPGGVVIDVGLKRDAVVPSHELQKMDPAKLEALKVGDRVNVFIMRPSDRQGNLIVSIRLAREYEDWLRAQELLESGEIFEATITDHNKGGLLCSFGFLQGFLPASQIANSVRVHRARSQSDGLAEFVGQQMALKVIEVDRRRRRLIVSERAARREWRAHQRERLMEELVEGEIRSGTVTSIRDFGAFVDLGGVDGLVHVSELSWARVKNPDEVVHVGEEIEVMVLRVDQERQRVGLSLKRTQPDPWAQIGDKYRPGQLITGVVAHVTKFGAFVELEPGVEGLVHLSELAEGAFGDPSSIVTEGEELRLLVLTVEPERHRVGLSQRQVLTSLLREEEEAEEEPSEEPEKEAGPEPEEKPQEEAEIESGEEAETEAEEEPSEEAEKEAGPEPEEKPQEEAEIEPGEEAETEAEEEPSGEAEKEAGPEPEEKPQKEAEIEPGEEAEEEPAANEGMADEPVVPDTGA